MAKDKDRDDELIAEAAEMFPPDTVDVQSRYVIVHQLRASADIQDAQTKRETGWADTSDRACLMRKAADTLDALLHKLQPAPKPDRAEVLFDDLYGKTKDEQIDCFRRHFNELRAEWEAERQGPSEPAKPDRYQRVWYEAKRAWWKTSARDPEGNQEAAAVLRRNFEPPSDVVEAAKKVRGVVPGSYGVVPGSNIAIMRDFILKGDQ